MKAQRFSFGMKFRPCKLDQTPENKFENPLKLWYNEYYHTGRHEQRNRKVMCLPTHCSGVKSVMCDIP